MERQHLKLFWILALLVAGVLAGLGREALQAVIDDGGLGIAGFSLLVGIGFITLPVILLSLVLWGIWTEGSDVRNQIAATAGAVWIGGWATSWMFDPAGSQAAERLIACETNVPGLIVCGLSRGLFMISRVYTMGFLAAGVVLASALVVTFWTLSQPD